MHWAFAALLLAAVLASTDPAAAQDLASQPATAPDTMPAWQAATSPATQAATVTATAPSTQPAAMAATEAATEPATTAEATSRPAASEPFDPNARITLNFRDASLRTVLEYLSHTAGLVVVDTTSTLSSSRVTVMSHRNVNVDEAVALLNTVLVERGYAAVYNGRTVKIVTMAQAKTELIDVRSSSDPATVQPTDRVVTQIIPIRNVDAVRLKADLATLIPATVDVSSNAASNTLIVTGTEAIIRRVMQIVKAVDAGGDSLLSVKVFQLKYANAASAARLITEIFREDQAAGQAGARANQLRAFVFPGMGGPGGRGPGVPGAPGGQPQDTGQRTTKVVASADDRTNTLVVSAAPEVMKVIEGVVKELDSNPDRQEVFIYRLKNAQAKNVESVLNTIFGWSGSTSGGTTVNRPNLSAMGSGGANVSSTGGRTNTNVSRGSSAINTTAGRTGTANQSRATGGYTTGGRGGAAAGSAATADLAGQVYVVADADTNSLAVTTATKNFNRVKQIIDDLDRAVPQVLIKCLIAEVTHDNSLDLGVEFSGFNLRGTQVVSGLNVGNEVPNTGTPPAPPMATLGQGQSAGSDFGLMAQAGGFTFKLEEKYVTAAIHALANVAKLDVLSRPYILTSDNQEAIINVGQDVPYIPYTQVSDTGTINTPIQYRNVGITLDVVPHINPQGIVTLDVYSEISSVTNLSVPISNTVNAPVFATRSANSRVAIRDGQTIVIGGLMEDRTTKSTDKVPFLGDIPGLGLLFQKTTDLKTKTELLIFLTPHVALQPDELKGMSEQEKAGTKIVQDSVEKGAYQEHLKGMELGASSRPATDDSEVHPIMDQEPPGQTPAEDAQPPADNQPGAGNQPAGGRDGQTPRDLGWPKAPAAPSGE